MLGSFDDDFYIEPTVESLQEKVFELEQNLNNAYSEIMHLNTALVLLKQHMAHWNTPPFGITALDKNPTQMTKEEIIEYNSKIPKERTYRAAAVDGLKQPTSEELEALYAEKGFSNEEEAHTNMAKSLVRHALADLKIEE